MLYDAEALSNPDGPSEGGKSGQKLSVGVSGHERIGAEYLRRLGFSEKIASLVEAHVAVKRYLTGTDSKYYDGLSNASKLSLKYQVCSHFTQVRLNYSKYAEIVMDVFCGMSIGWTIQSTTNRGV
jgi:predicted HD phosphohydrolase